MPTSAHSSQAKTRPCTSACRPRTTRHDAACAGPGPDSPGHAPPGPLQHKAPPKVAVQPAAHATMTSPTPQSVSLPPCIGCLSYCCCRRMAKALQAKYTFLRTCHPCPADQSRPCYPSSAKQGHSSWRRLLCSRHVNHSLHTSLSRQGACQDTARMHHGMRLDPATATRDSLAGTTACMHPCGASATRPRSFR